MSNQLVRGSLQDMANNQKTSLSKVFLDCEALILVDVSGSMDLNDCGNRKRFDVANEQLICLQRDNPGKVGVIPWNDQVSFAPQGLPSKADGGTDLVKALEFIKPADNCGLKFIVISDGCPHDPDGAIQLARTFTTKIDTIFVGPEGPAGAAGRDFMKRLAEASGGTPITQSVKEISLLNQTVSKLLKS